MASDKLPLSMVGTRLRKGLKYRLIGMMLALLILCPVMPVQAQIEIRRENSQTAEATTEVLGADLATFKQRNAPDAHGYRVRYRYAVNAKTYERTWETTWWEPGKPFKVCYNPKNPASAEERPLEFKCGPA